VGFRTAPAFIASTSGLLWEARHHKVRGYRKFAEESVALSGDEYILDLNFVVHYRPQDAVIHLFKVNRIHDIIRGIAESCMRQVLATEKAELMMTALRPRVLKRMEDLIGREVDRLGLGVEVLGVYCHDVHPPLLTLAKFRDVFSALEDQMRFLNEADGHRNEAIPYARIQRYRQLTDAHAFETEKKLRAEGEAQRFLLTAQAYRDAPNTTSYRLFVEAVEQGLAGGKKYIADPEANPGGYILWLFLPGPKGGRPGGL
jgi:regulator of protease activity HflC (stomatin/prohibitin superfamily)